MSNNVRIISPLSNAEFICRSSSRSSSREDKMVEFMIICVANMLCARSEGQFAMAVGNPINARALTGCAGESEKTCWCKGNI